MTAWMRRCLPAMAAALALTSIAASGAHATYTATRSGGEFGTGTLTDSAGASTNLVIYTTGENEVAHSLTTAGFNSNIDWDTTQAGDQLLYRNDGVKVILNAGDGDDALS